MERSFDTSAKSGGACLKWSDGWFLEDLFWGFGPDEGVAAVVPAVDEGRGF